MPVKSLTVEEAAHMLAAKPETVETWCAMRMIHSTDDPATGERAIAPDDLVAFIREQCPDKLVGLSAFCARHAPLKWLLFWEGGERLDHDYGSEKFDTREQALAYLASVRKSKHYLADFTARLIHGAEYMP